MPTKTTLAFIALVGATGLYLWRTAPEPAPPAAEPPSLDLSRMDMAQAVAHCHALWLAQHWDQAPLALAWQPQRVDWYVLSGTDTRSMLHYSCTGQGIEPGARYPRVLADRVPASDGEPRTVIHDRNLFLHYAARPGSFGPAMEAAQDPQDPVNGRLIERRWHADGSVDGQVPDGTTLADLPLLLSQPAPGLAVQGLPRLTALNAYHWLQEPAAMFSLLGDHLAPEQRIAAIDVRPDVVTLSIVGPVKNFDNKAPAPFGDATFDAYGVRDADWWYPRDAATQGCSTGYTLAEVKALYDQAAKRIPKGFWNAAFGCPQGPTSAGQWLLRGASRGRS